VRVALLEVGAARAAHEQRIPGEHPLVIGGDERQAAVGVPRGRPDLEHLVAEHHGVAVRERSVDVARADHARRRDRAAELALHQPRAGDVIGVAVSVERGHQAQPELADQRGVPGVLLEHRIDEDRLTGALAREQVGVRAGGGVEQLPEEHGGPAPTIPRARGAHYQVPNRPGHGSVEGGRPDNTVRRAVNLRG